MSLLLLFGGGGGGGGGPVADAGLQRVRDKLRLQLVRRLGDAGGPRADDVDAELDNLIAWAAQSPRCIHRDITPVGNVGAGEDDLVGFDVAANSLATDGDYISGWGSGNFATNDTDKFVRLYVGGTVVISMGATDIDIEKGWNLTYKIIRTSATTVLVGAVLSCNVAAIDSAATATSFTFGWYSESSNVSVTVSDLASSTLAIQFTAQGGADDDVTQNFSIIELCQQ